MREWVCCLQNAITAAHNSDQAPEVRGFGSAKERNEPLFSQHGSPNLNGNTDEDKQLLLQVRKIPGNEVCADCKSLSMSNGSLLAARVAVKSTRLGLTHCFVPSSF